MPKLRTNGKFIGGSRIDSQSVPSAPHKDPVRRMQTFGEKVFSN
jgi:hypothetical protein